MTCSYCVVGYVVTGSGVSSCGEVFCALLAGGFVAVGGFVAAIVFPVAEDLEASAVRTADGTAAADGGGSVPAVDASVSVPAASFNGVAAFAEPGQMEGRAAVPRHPKQTTTLNKITDGIGRVTCDEYIDRVLFTMDLRP